MIYQKSKAKDIISDKSKLKDIVSETIDRMATTVGATLGPGGRPVLIEREGLSPLITKDGVTVAKAMGIADSAANIVVDAAKEICINTAAEAGDGTTTAIVLANALIKEGQKFLQSNDKYNPQKFVNELHQAYNQVIVPFLKDVAIPAETEEQLLYVATISANGDKEIAKAAVTAVLAAGDDGHVQINEGQGRETRVDTIDSYVLTSGLKDLGQIGPSFINDKANQQSKMDAGYVFLYDGTINDLGVAGRLQDAVQEDDSGQLVDDGKPILVIAHGFADSVLDRFAKSTKSGRTVVPVKTPRSGVANGSSMLLEDVAAYTNAIVFNPGNIEELGKDDLGSFTEARINTYETFISAEPEAVDLEARIEELKSILNAAHSEYDKAHLRANIARLTGGISTILVGGTSDLEMREKKDRTEDAVEAVRSAIAEGIVTGGCSMHIILSNRLVSHPNSKLSWAVLAAALSAPFTRLMDNCGEDAGSVLNALMESYTYQEARLPNQVFDANDHMMVNPLEAGIIEPAKVVRVSIGNALSVAALLITLGGIVVSPSNPELDMQMELGRQAFDQMMGSIDG